MANDPKQIKYLNLTHPEFVKSLKEWGKIYFPESSKDLDNKASSGRFMIEQAAFIGDVLAFYLENRIKNSNLVTATDPSSVVDLADSKGWKFFGPSAARGIQSFYIEVPATTGSFGNITPNMSYALNFKNVQLQNNNGIIFEALEDVDFSTVNTGSNQEALVSRRNQATGEPTHFVLKKNVEVMAGKTVTETFSVGQYEPFRRVELSTKNVLDVLSVSDSDGNQWYEVDYLAQDAIFEAVRNAAADSEDVPYVLRLKPVPRRFIKKVSPTTGKTTLVFGSGKASEIGQPIVPDVSQLALDLKGKLVFSPPSIDPQNFLKTRTMGLAPYGTTLTIKVRSGGGRITNTAVNSLTDIISRDVSFSSENYDSTELNNTLNSLSTRNLSVIEGGEEADNIELIKQNASAHFAAQDRLTTKEDYIARSLSLPPIFGKIFRVYPVISYSATGGVQLYVLAKNNLGQITTASETLKKNLREYLKRYARIGQSIDIIDGKVINIGIEYSIVTEPGVNKSKVKFDTLLKVKEIFDVNKWQLNQPINLDDIRYAIKSVPGVISIPELKVVNKSNIVDGQTYSPFAYSIKKNTRSNIIFSIPEGIFEVKYPDSKDIKVSAI